MTLILVAACGWKPSTSTVVFVLAFRCKRRYLSASRAGSPSWRTSFSDAPQAYE